jgi:Mg2+ and Co2+ transporter CorA
VETFITVYEALKKEDEVLMEGYIVMYQEDEEPLHESDPIQTIDEITKIQNRYLRVLVLIKRRIYRLQKELTKAEQENPELLQETMRRQRMEILSRIQSEAEKIIYWREKIEGLVKTYLDYHS